MRRRLLETTLGFGLCGVAGVAHAAGSDAPQPAAFAFSSGEQPQRTQAAAPAPKKYAALTDVELAMMLGQIGEPPQGGASATAGTMVLEVTVNGTPTGQLLTMKRRRDGTFSAKAAELRELRFKLDPALGSQEDIVLNDLPGVTYRYDEARQAIALHVPDALLTAYEVGLGGARHRVDLDAIKPMSGLLLNYGIYASRTGGTTQVSGNGEVVAMTGIGIFATNALVNSQSRYGSGHATRLDSSWRLIDPKAIRSYTIGDFASNALSWTGSVRLAGFQIASAFDQRPDIVTTALPQFSGSAALPSTIDLFVNQQKIYSGEIPSGPFDLKSLPYVSGGDVRLVTTDASGRQVEMTKSYFYTANLLRQGVLQYSLDVGAPRLDYGIESFHYDDTVFASATVRYGLGETLTVEGHAEGSADGLVNGGAAVTKAMGGYGAITASFAGSTYKGDTGGKVSVEVDANLRGVRLFAGTDRTFGDYFDLGRVSSLRAARAYRTATPGSLADFIAGSAIATAVDRAGLSFTPWFDSTSVSLSYNRITSPGNRQRTGSLSLSRSITDRVTLYANGYIDLDDSSRYGLFATVNIRLGKNVSATAGAEHDYGRTSYSFNATGSTGQRQGDVGWGLSDRETQGGDAQRMAYATYRASQAMIRGEIDQSGGAWRGSAQIDGSIVAAGGGVFAANRIGNAFAIVTNGGPGAEVIQGGVRMGKTDRGGRALLPDMIPYYEQRVSIDPTSLPDAWEPEVTERVAVARYRQGTIVDFGARIIHGAVVVLQDAGGKPIPPGYTVQLQGGESATVGYGGETYLRGLGATNAISIDLGPRGICTASFPYDLAGPAQPKIGPLTCR